VQSIYHKLHSYERLFRYHLGIADLLLGQPLAPEQLFLAHLFVAYVFRVNSDHLGQIHPHPQRHWIIPYEPTN
jgi:hypothetical protein